jgi:hypothetical protein
MFFVRLRIINLSKTYHNPWYLFRLSWPKSNQSHVSQIVAANRPFCIIVSAASPDGDVEMDLYTKINHISGLKWLQLIN